MTCFFNQVWKPEILYCVQGKCWFYDVNLSDLVCPWAYLTRMKGVCAIITMTIWNFNKFFFLILPVRWSRRFPSRWSLYCTPSTLDLHQGKTFPKQRDFIPSATSLYPVHMSQSFFFWVNHKFTPACTASSVVVYRRRIETSPSLHGKAELLWVRLQFFFEVGEVQVQCFYMELTLL